MSLQADNKTELFPEMVQLFVTGGLIKDRVTAIRILEEREAKMSTGIANGLGLPAMEKLPEANRLCWLWGSRNQAIEYDSWTGSSLYRYYHFFAELENPGQHIQVLAEFSLFRYRVSKKDPSRCDARRSP